MPPARWLLPAPDRAAGRGALAAALGIGPPAAKVLVQPRFSDRRGARRFLHPRFDDLHDPLTMRDMPAALERLARAIRDAREDPDLRRLRRGRHHQRRAAHQGHRTGRRHRRLSRAAPAEGRLRHAAEVVEAAARTGRQADRQRRHRHPRRRGGARAPTSWASTSSSPIITCPKPNCRPRSRCSIPTGPTAPIPKRICAARASRSS